MKLSSSISSIRFPNFNTTFVKSYPSSFFPSFKFSTTSNRAMTQFPNFSIKNTNSSPANTAEDSQVAPPKPKPTPPPQRPWLIVGLGNPGKKYNGTRHNVGFEMVDAIAEAEGIPINTVNFKALFGKGFIGNVPVMLAKPQTFMNSSGESVGAIVSYYKIPLKQVLVIFDDLDLPFAKLRLLPKGGHGGHNGMRSIIDHFKGSRDFPRLRIGIGRPPGRMDAVNFVLRPFNKQEREELEFTFQHGIEAVRILSLEGFNKSATYVNSTKAMEQLG
ncbi:peptidyl-tRNA hydrolase, chloroplastic [Herrania umbratica]|uniref:peptidyl-tRNA hydrolase n=1 Tax=Herrania umbratica TaxID=108875 RepID=A0A6J1AYU1_9ROSI|nr:peptidyl-tRNA hydrolase, chloroplastic [Herrania umbratica]XP_021292148.1 peptidyl-tRNA hydrolase, chloroplastic [Herrania umbratica]